MDTPTLLQAALAIIVSTALFALVQRISSWSHMSAPPIVHAHLDADVDCARTSAEPICTNNPYGIPGPSKSDDTLGNFPEIRSAGGLHQYLTSLHKEYGDIAAFWFGVLPVVSVGSGRLLRHTLPLTHRPPALFDLFRPLIGDKSIQYANGADWRERRRRLDPAFTHSSVERMRHIFEEVVAERIAVWEQKYAVATDGHCKQLGASTPGKGHILRVPIHAESFELALRGIIITAFGRSSFGGDSEIEQLRAAYNTAWTEMEMRLGEGLPPEGSPRHIAFEAALCTLLEKVDAAVLSVDAASTPLAVPCGEGALLAALAGGGDCDARQVQNDAVTYFVGGFHTTGNFLTWMLYYLALHPDVQSTVASEIDTVFGSHDPSVAGGIKSDQMHMEQLKYLDCVLQETLRHRVLAPWAARTVPEDGDGITIGHYSLPPGAVVIQALGVAMHDGEQFDSPLEFRPERFSRQMWPIATYAADDQMNSPTVRPIHERACPSPLAHSPFGIGKRACPGQKYTMSESKTFLCTLLRRYCISLADPLQLVVPVYGLVVSPAEEIYLNFTPR